MDLGFAGLIQKIEERLGKWVGTLLMVCLSIIVFLWAVRVIVEVIIGLENARKKHNILDTLFATVVDYNVIIILAAFAAMVMVSIVNKVLTLRIQLRVKGLISKIENEREKVDNALAIADSKVKEAKAILARAEQTKRGE